MQNMIDRLSERQHDHLNNVLRGVAFVGSVPLAMVAVPWVAGLILRVM